MALTLGMNTLGLFEYNEIGINFDKLSWYYNHYSVGNCLTFLILDTLILFILGFYLDQVLPSNYGIPKPWNFLFSPSYWRGRGTQVDKSSIGPLKNIEPGTVENVSAQLQQQEGNGEAILIRNLQKIYDNGTSAVNGLDLTIYNGQITALLGHNGAGKTTTLSMLCGMIPATGGQLSYDNQEYFSNIDQIRTKMGICPQHNILFNDLTVAEHLYVFATFKGMHGNEEKQQEIQKIIQDMDLADKQDTLSKNLSGGQKRKLSIAIAVCANSSIILLDEPTAGLDLTARRKMWDKLKTYKHNKIIILTTHYMEEADILGDRVAIMSEGRLRCCGSSLFLKNKFGVGYTVTFVRDKLDNESEYIYQTQQMTNILETHLGKYFSLENDSPAEIVYVLPIESSNQFKALFTELDQSLKSLKISAYGVQVTTLEQVFLKLAKGEVENKRQSMNRTTFRSSVSDMQNTVQNIGGDNTELGEYQEDKESGQKSIRDPLLELVDQGQGKNVSLSRQFAALLKKRMLQSKRDKFSLCCEILLPIILTLFGLIAIKSVANLIDDQPEYNEIISKYKTPQVIFYNTNPDLTDFDYSNDKQLIWENYSKNAKIEEIMKYIQDWQGDITNVTAVNTANVEEFNDLIFNISNHKPYRRGSFYFHEVNATGNQYKIVIFQNGTAFQAAPTYYNLIASGILGKKIELINNPFPLTDYERKNSPLAIGNGVNTAITLAIAFSFVPISVMITITKDRLMFIKEMLYISGASPLMYWIANLLWDYVKFLIPASVCIFLVSVLQIDSLSESDVIGYVVAMMYVYGFPTLAMTYFLSLLFSNMETANFTTRMVQWICSIILIVAGLVLTSLYLTVSDTIKYPSYIVCWIGRFLPSFSMGYGIAMIAWRDFISINLGYSNTLAPFNHNIAGTDFGAYFVQFGFYFSLVLICEYLAHVKFLNRVFSPNQIIEIDQQEDEDVQNERNQTEQIDPKDVAVKACNLGQTYGNKCNTSNQKVAIRGISFAVERSQIFALLGINGAGKSSTFKILTGEMSPSTGAAWISGHSIEGNFKEIYQTIGYCPQYNILTDQLTVQENLELFAEIKGIQDEQKQREIKYLKQLLDIDRYSDKEAKSLSGGNKRKLCMALTLQGSPQILFLDEPTAGMDPQARQHLFQVINKQCFYRKCSVVITTHSMEEAELIANRIVIMVNGRFKCIGTAQHLKSKFGFGYEIDVNVLQPSQELVEEQMNQIAQQMNLDVNQFITIEDIQNILSSRQLKDTLGHQVSESGSGSAIFQLLKENKKVDIKLFCE